MPHSYKTTSFNSLNSENHHGQQRGLLQGFQKLEQSIKIMGCIMIIIVLLAVGFVVAFLLYGNPRGMSLSADKINMEGRANLRNDVFSGTNDAITTNRSENLQQNEKPDFYQAYGTPVRGHCGIGMVDGRVKDSQITASRYHDRYHQPKLARLYKPVRGWLAAVKGDWIQIELEEATLVSGILTQGDYASNYWTMSYNVQYGNDSRYMTTIQDQNGDKIFDGNKDRLTVRSTYFVRPLFARVFRVVVLTFHSMPSVRMELLTPTLLTTANMADLPSEAICRVNNLVQVTVES